MPEALSTVIDWSHRPLAVGCGKYFCIGRQVHCHLPSNFDYNSSWFSRFSQELKKLKNKKVLEGWCCDSLVSEKVQCNSGTSVMCWIVRVFACCGGGPVASACRGARAQARAGSAPTRAPSHLQFYRHLLNSPLSKTRCRLIKLHRYISTGFSFLVFRYTVSKHFKLLLQHVTLNRIITLINIKT